MLRIKETKRLFMDKYSYKAVLVVPASSWFRTSEFSNIKDRFKNFQFGAVKKSYVSHRIQTQEDFDYCFKLYRVISKMQDYEIRVESPCISFYTNNITDIDKLIKVAGERTKYVSKPNPGNLLSKKTIIMTRKGFDFKVTLGSTRQNYNDFIEWADNTGLAKLTKSTRRSLAKEASWGGTYFYVKNDKALTMTKVFLGGCISRVEQIVAASD